MFKYTDLSYIYLSIPLSIKFKNFNHNFNYNAIFYYCGRGHIVHIRQKYLTNLLYLIMFSKDFRFGKFLEKTLQIHCVELNME